MLKSLLKNKTRGNRVEFWLKRKGKKSDLASDMNNMLHNAMWRINSNPNWGIGGGLSGAWAGTPITATSMQNMMGQYVVATSSTQGAI